MSDEIDWAQEIEERERGEALRRVKRASAAASLGLGRTDCAGCGDPIPPARRRAMPNAELCVACQNVADRKFG